MAKGGIFGKFNNPTSTVASGMWSIREQEQLIRASNWPVLTKSLSTDGLVFHLDAGNTTSYSGSGSAWNDLAGTNNCTLVNSPTYSSNFGGYFNFNGTNQEVTTSASVGNLSATSYTYFGWFRTSTASGKKL